MANIQFTKDVPFLPGYSATVPLVLGISTTQTSATNETKDVTGSRFEIPANTFTGNMAFRFTLGGTKAGANNAMVVNICLGVAATAVLPLTADAASAGDWRAVGIVAATNAAVQACLGTLLLDTEDPEVNYAAGAVDMRAGGPIKAQIVSAHGSDTVTCDFCMVEVIKL